MSNSIRGVATVTVDWISQLIHDDPNGVYVSFSLNTRYSQKQLIQRWERFCGKDSFVWLIPAYSHDGRLHYHGLCRFPKSDAPWVTFTIRQSGEAKIIQIPELLRRMLKNAKTKNPESAFGDLHLMNDGDRVTFLTHESESAKAVLGYWLKTSDGEVRDVNSGVFFPHPNRQRINVRKGRTPKWEKLVRKSRPTRQPDTKPQPPSITRDVLTSEMNAFLANGGSIKKLPPVVASSHVPQNGVSRRSQRVNRLGMRGVKETPTAQRGQRHWTL